MEGRPQEGPPALPGQQASPLAPGMGELHAGFHGGATFAQHDTVHYASTPAAIPQVNSTAPQVSPATPQCVDPSLSSTSTASFQPHTSSGTTGSAHLSYLPPHPPNGSMYSGPPLHENPRGFASLPASPSPHPHAHSTMGSYGTPAMRPPDNYRSHGASPSVHGNGQCTTGSVPSPTPQPRMDASPYSLAPGPQVPRTPSQQAALFDAPNDSWTATVRFLGQQSSNLLVRLEKVEAKEAEMVVSLKYLQQQNQDLTARLLALEALQPSKTREEGWTTLRVKAKEHGVRTRSTKWLGP
ncbi:hypothetical protein BV20DRAFT_963928 [Pilatotrama ljubarskyi]|nr:hypothetical protein BV20DRAFT_963928 [Pilatotrama ljubarskyi]